MKKVSMQDIADKVGVSRCTVSLALSGKGRAKRVSEALCDKIMQAAKEMHYEPNELARSLRTGLTKTLGVVIADISNEFFGELSYHIQKRANSLGYNIIITNSDEVPEKMLESIRLLINRRVDGIIMVPTNSSVSIANRIVSLGIPFVQVDRFIPGLNASYVVLDNYKASEALTEKFYAEREDSVLFDDRDRRPGEKFADADLIGLPIRIVISDRTLGSNEAEITDRKTGKSWRVGISELFEKF